MKALNLFLLTVTALFVGIFFYFNSTDLFLNKAFENFISQEEQIEIKSFLTTIHGSQKLQLAELDQIEEFSETSRRKIFWEKLELPPVIVSVELPVRFTYYIDLEKEWSVNEGESEIILMAPPLEYNRPATDLSEIKINYKKSSLLRDEESVKNRLFDRLSTYLGNRALENKALVRETARKELHGLIEKWLVSHQKKKKLKIYFQDQSEELL